MGLNIQPITWQEFQRFCNKHHSTHDSVQGWKFGLGVNWKGRHVVGVQSIGTPQARHLDDGVTLEVTRNCVRDDLPREQTKNAASKMYAAAWRAARALGYHRLVSYTLSEQEDGTPLKAAGYEVMHQTEGGSWDSENRPRVDTHPTVPKDRWEKWQTGVKVEVTE